ncbi:MAG: hypothetical protein ACLSB7_07780 [Parabacteroides distasonis]
MPSSPSEAAAGKREPARKEARHDELWSYGGFRFQSSHRLRHGMYGIDVAGRLPVRKGRAGKAVEGALALTYLVTSLGWLGLVLYSVAPCAFSYYHPVFLLTLMLDQVMFSVVSMITDTGERRRLNRWHWVVPVFLMGPRSRRYTGKSVFIYNTLYPALNLRNIYRYRRFIVDYSSEAQRISLIGWRPCKFLSWLAYPFRWRDCCSIWRLSFSHFVLGCCQRSCFI